MLKEKLIFDILQRNVWFVDLNKRNSIQQCREIPACVAYFRIRPGISKESERYVIGRKREKEPDRAPHAVCEVQINVVKDGDLGQWNCTDCGDNLKL